MVIEPGALHLRFRDDAAIDEPLTPPDLDAFVRAPRASADHRLADDLGVLPGTRPVDPDGPLVIFLQDLEFGIPAPGYDHGLPDLESWSVRPTTFGWIASVSPATRGGGPRRAAQVLAGCLALALPHSADARVDAPATPPPAQAPASSPPAQIPPPPVQAPTSSIPPAAPPGPPTQPEPPPATPGASTQTESATPVPPPPPPPRIPDANAVTDAAWEGIDGHQVVLELKGGRVLRGRIGAVQADTFVLIDASDGQILVIPKSGVSSLRAHVPPPIPTQTGTGLIAGGSVLTALGVPVFLTGIAFVAICPSCIEIHLPMLFVGGGAMGGGIPMIARGVQRRSAFQKALMEQRVAPVVSRTPYNGWTGGLQFRF